MFIPGPNLKKSVFIQLKTCINKLNMLHFKRIYDPNGNMLDM